jgi:hypothetical protein
MWDDPGKDRVRLTLVKRHLFNLLAGASLVICVAMTGIWIASYLDYPLDFYRATASRTTGAYFHFGVSASRGRDRLIWASESPLAPGEKPQPNLPMIHYS